MYLELILIISLEKYITKCRTVIKYFQRNAACETEKYISEDFDLSNGQFIVNEIIHNSRWHSRKDFDADVITKTRLLRSIMLSRIPAKFCRIL